MASSSSHSCLQSHNALLLLPLGARAPRTLTSSRTETLSGYCNVACRTIFFFFLSLTQSNTLNHCRPLDINFFNPSSVGCKREPMLFHFFIHLRQPASSCDDDNLDTLWHVHSQPLPFIKEVLCNRPPSLSDINGSNRH